MENGVSSGGYHPRPPFGEYPSAMAVNMMPAGPMMHTSMGLSMGQYPMMAMPMPMGMPGMMISPQMTQMYAGAAQTGPKGNIFFKTRLCNKWRSGSCPYGDKCTYAHGQHELRYIPPEMLKELEDQQALEPQPASNSSRESPKSQPESQGGAGPVAADQSKRFYKTRLCIKFMQTGYCSRGSACTFAHGHQDINPSGTFNGMQMQMQQAHMPMNGRYQYPPAGSYPGMPELGGGQLQHRSNGRHHAGPGDRISPEVRRARGMSAIADVGNAAAAADDECVTTALEAVSAGNAFKESAYGDSVQ